MHYFESQLISTTKAIEQSDEILRFKGHYVFGDGGVLLAFPVVVGAISLAYAFFAESPSWIGVVISLLTCLGLILLLLFFHKITEIHSNRGGLQIHTRNVWGRKVVGYKTQSVRLEVSQIHIRLATDCGAVDLVLPNAKIRLLVVGKYEWAVQKAEAIATFSGLELERPSENT